VVVEALVAELPVEALDVAVLDGLAGSDEVDLPTGELARRLLRINRFPYSNSRNR
jgi:hypothetical protein